jgi:hypothetical protein
MKTRLFSFIVLICAWLSNTAQVNPDFVFLQHLAENRKYNDAVYLLHLEKTKLGSDTVNYLLGYNQHFLKHPDSAGFYFDKVPVSSAFITPSKFLQSLSLLYLKSGNTYKVLDNLNKDTLTKYRQLYYLCKGANLLIDRNYKGFDSVTAGFTYDDYNYTVQEKNLVDLRNKLLKQKRKSPVLAAGLSALVPGLGKFYAGKKGAALSAFFINLVLGGITYESYYRSGYKSPQFIGFGALFSFFYVGNIMGSAFSIKQQTRSVNGRINNEIISTVHIPINRFFVR